MSGDIVLVIRVYETGKWVKVEYEDGHAEWARAVDLERVEGE